MVYTIHHSTVPWRIMINSSFLVENCPRLAYLPFHRESTLRIMPLAYFLAKCSWGTYFPKFIKKRTFFIQSKEKYWSPRRDGLVKKKYLNTRYSLYKGAIEWWFCYHSSKEEEKKKDFEMYLILSKNCWEFFSQVVV